MKNSRPFRLTEIADYYSTMLAKHGDTARGVDWNSPESQQLRFGQLTKVVQEPRNFSLHDLGCGYGALYDYLRGRFQDFHYYGWDISDVMVRAAQTRFAGCTNASFVLAAEPQGIAAYGVASGIFNVRLNQGDAAWRKYIGETLDALNNTCRLGFAFNCLTSYSDAGKMKDYLYYADPSAMFDRCKRRYSPNVSLLHDYGLYEFTIIVRK